MADYYRLSSFVFPLLSQDEAERAMRIAQEIEYKAEQEDDCTGFDASIVEDPLGLWVRHDSSYSFNTNWAAELVQALMNEFNVRDGEDVDPFEFTWADSCSSPRVDAFRGGKAIIHFGAPPEFTQL